MSNNKKKKEEEKILDPYTKMSSTDLIGKIKEWHSDTPEAEDRKKEKETKFENAISTIDDIERDYLKDVRGEHARYKGKPKSYMLGKENTKEEASELIYRMTLESIRQELGEKAFKLYKKNPEWIPGFLRGKGIDFYKLRTEMVDNRRNFREGETYKEFKKRLPTIEELIEEKAVEMELLSDPNHYDPLLDQTNEKIQETDLQIKKGVEAQHVLNHLKKFLKEGKYTEAYKRDNEEHFKKYKEKK